MSEAVKYTPRQLARLLRIPEPTPEQAAVIGAPLAPVAVIAGAGSGKSETMAARLVWLVVNGFVRPDRVLGLTFTRKAAAELADRVRSRLERLSRAGLPGPPPPGEPVISTYHAYAGRLVSDHALREGLEPSMRLITPALSWQLASNIVSAYDGPMDDVPWTPQTVTAAVLQLAGDLSEHLRQPQDVRDVGEWLAVQAGSAKTEKRPSAAVRRILGAQRAREQLLPLVERYIAAKQGREVLDHGDQVALAARIAARHPEVGAAERTRYQAVLLDEYQDTSHAQLVLLRALFGGGHPVTAVGDPCQSIYGWRGASAGNLRRFSTDFPVRSGEPSDVRKLSTSFRNAGRVLDAAAVIQEELRAEAPDVPVLVPAPDRGGRGAVTCGLLPTIGDEADWVAARAAELLNRPAGTAPDGQPWPDGRGAGVRPSDIAVLCRKRSQFIPLRKAFEARGIPCEVVGLGGLLSVPEVQDVVATLRVLQDASASDALARLLTGPRWRIGPRDLVALGRRARDLATGETDGSADPPDEDGKEGAGEEAAGEDALAEAMTDLTADTGSLVEALDDLGDPDGYSQAGYRRLSALAAETRRLRAHIARPLGDLVAEVERALSLDIEVAARPGTDPGAARADLDAFTDVAAAFAGDQPDPTLGAFLAYLTAAEQEEFGLEPGRVGEADTVKLLTVHAAKGLQWPAVFVPGLAAGQKSQVFPARPRQSTRWTDNPRLIPFGLRGDAGDLPSLEDLSGEEITEFTSACAARDLAEERRLAYVACTRAAFWLGCSGYWWGDGASPLGPSDFLSDVRRACADGAGTIGTWAPAPPEDADNPLLATVEEAEWPLSAPGRNYEAVWFAGHLVRSSAKPSYLTDQAGSPAPEPSPDALPEADRELIAAWERDAGLLLAEAERQRQRGDGPVPVFLPSRLSVSSLVTLARDPDELARQVRRPMPRPPAVQARRGTEFHQWLEERFGQQRLIDDQDLFAESPEDAEEDSELGDLKARFEAGEWGGRWPREVEVPFDIRIADRQIRGRIDAVFADDTAEGPGEGFDVVDWKTGRLPRGKAELDAVAVQLAAYRLAWAALSDVPLDRVRAAFYYVRYNTTVRPADLLDEAGLLDLINRVPVAEG